MPGFDGTGPRGMGPMTGGGFGYCAGYLEPEDPMPARPFGRGFGNRRAPGTGGRGRGRMNVFYATGLPGWVRSTPVQPVQQLSKEQETQQLESQAKLLEQELEQIKIKIKELKER